MPAKNKTRETARSSRKKQSSKQKQPKRRQRQEPDAPPMPSRFMMERAMAQMFRLGGGGPVFEAQQLAYDAMEAADREDFDRAGELALEAVDVHPGCLDAVMLLLDLECESTEELIGDMEPVLEAFEEALGPEFFEENRGCFWDILGTRPYMRARTRLAGLLFQAGRVDEALNHYEVLLDLNPGDNQGIRYGLLGLYLEHGRLEKASALFERYEGEWSAMFKWSRVLERWLNDDPDGARDALAEARETNPHVEPLLVGRKRMPRKRPDYYSPGDEHEAAICVEDIGPAWKKHRQAVAWLKAQE